jgi:RNA polymerase sigma factor (TIGR02999 family)
MDGEAPFVPRIMVSPRQADGQCFVQTGNSPRKLPLPRWRRIFSFVNPATDLLNAAAQGDCRAAERLLPLVYQELRKLAAARLAQETPGQTLQATALVHEAYLRLVGSESSASYRDRHHFFAMAATAMRRILVDGARAKLAEKRGGGHAREPLEDVAAAPRDEEVLALHEALEKLAGEDPLKAQLVELRYFAGLTGDQAAAVLGISPSAADRHWAFARAWLQAEVRGH